MKRCGNQQQQLTGPVKKQDGHQQSSERQSGIAKESPQGPLRRFCGGEFRQASPADDAVIVLDDAFAAKKVAAFRALSDRFASRVIETMALVQ
jgi:hypothetical protein